MCSTGRLSEWTVALPVLEEMDVELARVARAEGPVRLRLGQALEALGRVKGHEELGFSSLAGYAYERIGRGGRWAVEARAMARRLAKLPRVRAAVADGTLSWSMAEVLSRKATAETEAALVEEARVRTVRQMKAKFAEVGDDGDGDDDGVPMRTITRTVPVPTSWALELARMMASAIQDRSDDEAVVSALLGEAESSMFELAPGFDAKPEREEEQRSREHRKLCAAWTREAEEMVEGELSLHVEPPRFEADPPLPSTNRRLDGEIRRLAARLAERDVVVGDLARRIFEANGWRRLGYASEAQYARERAGCSVASLRARITLSRRSVRFPDVAKEMKEGGLGFETAGLVARIATEKTLAAWIERAKERTYVFLKEEVEAIELLARGSGDPGVLEFGPPDQELLDGVKEIQRKVLSGEAFQMFGGQVQGKAGEVFQMFGGGEPGQGEEEAPKGKLRPGAGKVTVRMRVTEETYWQWKALERAYRRTRLVESFEVFLAKNFWSQWSYLGTIHSGVAKRVLGRDLYRCSSPVCGRRWVQIHHLVYRSRGGGNGIENLVALCPFCHQHGIHEGRLKALPPASDITWVIGRDPIMVVKGRRKYELPPGAWHAS